MISSPWSSPWPVSRQLGGLQAGLVAVEQVELLGAEAGDLAGELGADGPAGAGDQDRASGDLFGDDGGVQGDRAAAQEVFEVDVAQVV